MPCDTKLRAKQTVSDRAVEVRRAVATLDRLVAQRSVKVVVGPQGAIAFSGWRDDDRDGVTDACAFRRLMVSGSALARAEIARAEQLAGRGVDRKVVAQGTHSHDHGVTWHGKG